MATPTTRYMCRHERLILEALLKRTNVHTRQIVDILYGADPNGGPDQPHKLIAVRVSQLRKRLRPYGVVIVCRDTEHGVGSSYAIPDYHHRQAAREFYDHHRYDRPDKALGHIACQPEMFNHHEMGVGKNG